MSIMNTIQITFSQNDVTFTSVLTTINAISVKEAAGFVAKAFMKQATIQRLIVPAKDRAKLSEPFNIELSTSDGETYTETMKLSIPGSKDRFEALTNKLSTILGLMILNEADKDFTDQYYQLKQGTLALPFVGE